jgi:hypothetical protein
MNTIRRVILRHTGGPYPGLRQILGTVEGAEVPGRLESGNGQVLAFWPDFRTGAAVLVAAEQRYVTYQEVPAA